MNLDQLANLGEFVGGVAVLLTLIYVAVQVRQGAIAQQHTNDLAQADAMQRTGAAFGAFRKMLAEPEMNAVWFKARNEGELTPEEEHLLFVALAELTYSAVASMASMESVGDVERAEAIPGVVVREMRGSRTLHRIWMPFGDDLEAYGFAPFADAVRTRIAASGAEDSPS